MYVMIYIYVCDSVRVLQESAVGIVKYITCHYCVCTFSTEASVAVAIYRLSI